MQATKVSLQSWKAIAQERAYSFMLPAGLLLRKEYLEVLHFVGGCTAVDAVGAINRLQLCCFSRRHSMTAHYLIL
jgi:hypothetical protein